MTRPEAIARRSRSASAAPHADRPPRARRADGQRHRARPGRRRRRRPRGPRPRGPGRRCCTAAAAWPRATSTASGTRPTWSPSSAWPRATSRALDDLRRRARAVRVPVPAPARRRAGARHARAQPRSDIAAHYDLGNDLFELMLDDDDDVLGGVLRDARRRRSRDASLAKLELVCDKLDLGPEDHVARDRHGLGRLRRPRRGDARLPRHHHDDLGRAARLRRARACARPGVEDRVDRPAARTTATCAAATTSSSRVEMIEAVGWRDFGTFFARCSRLLAARRRDAPAGDHDGRPRLRGREGLALVHPHAHLPQRLPALAGGHRALRRARHRHARRPTSRTSPPHYARRSRTGARTSRRPRSAWTRSATTSASAGCGGMYLAYCEAGFAERRIGAGRRCSPSPGGAGGRRDGRRPDGRPRGRRHRGAPERPPDERPAAVTTLAYDRAGSGPAAGAAAPARRRPPRLASGPRPAGRRARRARRRPARLRRLAAARRRAAPRPAGARAGRCTGCSPSLGLDGGRAHLAGNSLGGWVALEAALSRGRARASPRSPRPASGRARCRRSPRSRARLARALRPLLAPGAARRPRRRARAARGGRPSRSASRPRTPPRSSRPTPARRASAPSTARCAPGRSRAWPTSACPSRSSGPSTTGSCTRPRDVPASAQIVIPDAGTCRCGTRPGAVAEALLAGSATPRRARGGVSGAPGATADVSSPDATLDPRSRHRRRPSPSPRAAGAATTPPRPRARKRTTAGARPPSRPSPPACTSHGASPSCRTATRSSPSATTGRIMRIPTGGGTPRTVMTVPGRRHARRARAACSASPSRPTTRATGSSTPTTRARGTTGSCASGSAAAPAPVLTGIAARRHPQRRPDRLRPRRQALRRHRRRGRPPGSPRTASSLNGKILRLNPDGSVPARQPVPGSPVWSSATATCRASPGTAPGRLWATEFGQNTLRRGQPHPEGPQLRLARSSRARRHAGRQVHQPARHLGDQRGVAVSGARDRRHHALRRRAARGAALAGAAATARARAPTAAARGPLRAHPHGRPRARRRRCGSAPPTATAAAPRPGDDRIVRLRP